MEKKEKGKTFEAPQDRGDALEKVLKDLHKTFGDGSIMRLGEATANMNVEVIPTDILPLDVAVGLVVGCTMFGFYSLFRRGTIGGEGA